MNLEGLANELLLDVFGYLSAIDVLRGFYNLNARFNCLVADHFRTFRLEFSSVSRTDFEHACRTILPTIAHGVAYLTLSDDDDTPRLAELFLSNGMNLRQFHRLQSLSLVDICSNAVMGTMLVDWQHLSNLTRLTLAGCYLQFSSLAAQHLIDSIWSLPQLRFCYLNVNLGEIGLPIPAVTSSSLRSLAIWGLEQQQEEINGFLKQTPALESLSVLLNTSSNPAADEYLCLSLTKVSLYLSSTEEVDVTQFLRNTPNLRRLTVHRWIPITTFTNEIADGHRWETFIRAHLPHLQHFHLYVERCLASEDTRESDIAHLLDSFRTPFWLEEHRWFVRCAWNPTESPTILYLHTLPYASTEMRYDCALVTRSTCPDGAAYRDYHRVKSLIYHGYPNGTASSSNMQFSNVNCLEASRRIPEQFWLAILQPDRIISASFFIETDFSTSELSDVLQHLPRLCRLKLNGDPTSNCLPAILGVKHPALRQLDLRECAWSLDDQQCQALSCSPLGHQLKTLCVDVKNQTGVLELIEHMRKLCVLIVQFPDDQMSNIQGDPYVDWLRARLPSTCLIARDEAFQQDVHIWIR